jgi:hypothetical protein
LISNEAKILWQAERAVARKFPRFNPDMITLVVNSDSTIDVSYNGIIVRTINELMESK